MKINKKKEILKNVDAFRALDNEQKYPKTTIALRIFNSFITSISVIASIIISIISLCTVNEVKETLNQHQSQQQEQFQSIENEIDSINSQSQSQEQMLESIQHQYQIMQNILNQEQTVDVIQARDNDVLIKTPDDKWIVVPMIEKEDIIFPVEILEKQYNVGECSFERMDLFNFDNDDWSNRDSFTYTIPYISINQNKMVSLYQFINKIDVEFKFYKNDQIQYETYKYELFNKDNKDEYEYLNVFNDVSPKVQFVTNEINDGIEDIKINIIIEFEIGGSTFSIPYTFDSWLNVNQDIIGL